MGRKDGITKRKLAEFLSRLLSIPERFVDGIEVMDRFSLATLPKHAANDAIKMSKKKRGLPVMRLDAKDDFRPSSRGGKKNGAAKTKADSAGKKRKKAAAGGAEKYKRKSS